jgi:hypothetical protein
VGNIPYPRPDAGVVDAKFKLDAVTSDSGKFFQPTDPNAYIPKNYYVSLIDIVPDEYFQVAVDYLARVLTS